MINVKNMTKKYGHKVAANNVSLIANPGEITVLLGENGAGKSTTIKSIIGLLEYEGEISICGYDNHSVEAKKRFGYIPEVPVLYDLLTVQEHIDFIGHAYDVNNYKDLAAEYLELFRLDSKRDTIAKELSKGMRQKLSMILALITKPKAILVDEPMMGLDPQSIEDTLKLLKDLKDKGTSVLLSTHVIDIVSDVWDRAYIMKNGHVICEVLRKDIKDKSLKEIYFEVGKEI
ncbi:ABC transporter ATP-binding protein [Erysipelothrix rhusiopathiae]|nr:ABC transporter ATP-binding protein [Erysipelothrix rhusiopathiae]